MEKIRTIIVDDEPLAREGLRRLLAVDSDIEILCECGDGVQAVKDIDAHKPDLVFLDVQMPEIDGFAVLEALDPRRMPAVIFVTAYDRYALDAFKIHATDYILKPVDKDRFRTALDRAKADIRLRSAQAVNDRLLNILDHIRTREKIYGRIVVKSAGRIFFLKIDEIDWIEAAGDYVYIHTRKEKHLLRETMASLEARLDPEKFIRIHRSIIVNIDCIKELEPMFHGDYAVRLYNGSCLTSGRTYRDRLERLLKKDI